MNHSLQISNHWVLLALGYLVVFFLGTNPFNNAYAWEKTTHKKMTERAVQWAVQQGIDTFIPQEFNLDDGLSTKLEGRSAAEWIIQGSYNEDVDENFLAFRVRNHFHDPLALFSNAGISGGISSIEWSLAPVGLQNFPFGRPRSWHDARLFFFLGLTEPRLNERRQNLAKTFDAIGHVVHLLQDAGNPAHVRNDVHLTLDDQKPADEFHTYMRNREDDIASSIFPLFGNVSPLARILSTPSGIDKIDNHPLANLFDNNTYNGGNPSGFGYDRGSGISEFTNANFFSDDTLPPNSNYPHPSEDELDCPFTTFPYCSLDRQHPFSFFSIFLERAVKREPTYVTFPFSQPSPTYALDNSIFDAYAERLIPVVISTSTGALRYFFRGKLEALGEVIPGETPNGLRQVKLTVTNLSEEDLGEGVLIALADGVDNENTIRTQLPFLDQVSTNGQVATLVVEVPDNIAATEPDGETRFYVVYRGQLGSEPDAVIGTSTDILLPPVGPPDFLGVTRQNTLVTIKIRSNPSGDMDIFASPVPNTVVTPLDEPSVQSLAYEPFNKLVTGMAHTHRLRPDLNNFPLEAAGTQKIDPTTGAVTDDLVVEAGHSLFSAEARALAVSTGGTTIISGGGFLLRLEPGQGFFGNSQFLNLFFTDGSNITALAFSPNGTLYGWDSRFGLVTVNPGWSGFINFPTDFVSIVRSQGRPPEISSGSPIESIEFTQEGNLIGTRMSFTLGTQFFEINPTTGDVNQIGFLENVELSAIARP